MIVQDLVAWFDAAASHSDEGTAAGEDKFAFAIVLESFDPGGIGVDVVKDHYIPVAEAGDDRKTSRLVGV